MPGTVTTRLLWVIFAVLAAGCQRVPVRGEPGPVQVCLEGQEEFWALPACDQALAAASSDGERALLLFQRATLRQPRGEPESVLADLDQAIALRPAAASPYRLRSTVRARLGQTQAALDDVRRFVRQTPEGDVEGLVWASYALEQLGVLEEGLVVVSRALAVDPHDPAALNSRCWKRALLSRELPAALADCEQAVRLTPAEPGVHDSLGLVLFRLGRMQDAIASCTSALTLDAASPSAAHSYFVRALARQASGDADAAAADLKQAHALDPQIAAYFQQFGVGPGQRSR